MVSKILLLIALACGLSAATVDDLILTNATVPQSGIVQVDGTNPAVGFPDVQIVPAPGGANRLMIDGGSRNRIYLGTHFWGDGSTIGSPSIQMISAGNDAPSNAPFMRMDRSGGTMANPTKVLANYLLTAFSARGYDGTNWGGSTTYLHSDAAFEFFAAETWTTASHPTYAVILNTAPGSHIKRPTHFFTARGSFINDFSNMGGEPVIPGVSVVSGQGGNGFSVVTTNQSVAGGFYGFRARNVPGTPTAIQAGDVITFLQGRGYGATGFSSGARGVIRIDADENWTDAKQGTAIKFLVTRNGTASAYEAVRVSNDGDLIVAGAVSPSASGVIWEAGAGSPEGIVAAPVGSLYSRTDGGAGATLYVKESGSGNIGWIPK